MNFQRMYSTTNRIAYRLSVRQPVDANGVIKIRTCRELPSIQFHSCSLCTAPRFYEKNHHSAGLEGENRVSTVYPIFIQLRKRKTRSSTVAEKPRDATYCLEMSLRIKTS